jgi:hypothetical protein
VGQGPPHCRGFSITLTHTTLRRTPLDEGSARRRDLYLTTHNTHKTQPSMSPPWFEPAIPASERPQTHAPDQAANGIDQITLYIDTNINISFILVFSKYRHLKCHLPSIPAHPRVTCWYSFKCSYKLRDIQFYNYLHQDSWLQMCTYINYSALFWVLKDPWLHPNLSPHSA